MSAKLDQRVSDMRAFNRFYTGVIGVLQEHLLHSPYSLTEVRVMYELSDRGQAVGDAEVLLAVGRCQHDLSPQHNAVLGGPLPNDHRQRVTILVAQLDHGRAVPGHRGLHQGAPPVYSDPSALLPYCTHVVPRRTT